MFKNIITLILFVFFYTNVFALPKCPGEKRNLATWKNCNGSYTAIDGHTYSGEFDSNGQYTGVGKLNNKGGIYEGEFLKNKFHGKGKQIIPNDDGSVKAIYEGEFFMGSWHGKGILRSPDGAFIYDGEFQNY